MDRGSSYVVVLCIFLFSINIFAADFRTTDMSVVDGQWVEGAFGNGAGFTYRYTSNGKAKLTYRNTTGESSVVAEKIFNQLPKFVTRQDGFYIPNHDDHAAFFEDEENLYVLTDEGLFQPVFATPERFTKGRWSIRAHLFDGQAHYAVISAVYQPGHKMSSSHSGETHVLRLNDGKMALFDRTYRSDVSRVTMLDGVLSFDATTRFSVRNFEEEGLARESANPYSPPTSLVKVIKPKEREWTFENGAKLVTVNGARPKTANLSGEAAFYFEDASGNRTLIANEQAKIYPSDYYEGAAYEGPGTRPRPDQKIVFIETQDSVWFVTETGASVKIPADYSKIKENAYMAIPFAHKGKQFMLISFFYDTYVVDEKGKRHLDNQGETFLIREDGKFCRVDYLKHNLGEEADAYRISDGILEMPDGRRSIDLERFDIEAKFNAEPMEEVKAEDGKTIVEDPTVWVKEKFHDLGAEQRMNHSAFKPINTKAIESMRVALQKPGTSVVLVGESGVGKTELINSFVADIVAGKYPEIPRTTRVLQMDSMTLSGGTIFVGAFEARMKAISEAIKAVPTIIAIDNVHTLRGAGTHSGNQNDAFQVMEPLMKRKLRIIGTSTNEQFDHAFAGDQGLNGSFDRITVAEPKGEDVLMAADNWMEKNGMIKSARDDLRYGERLSTALKADGFQPKKLISLMSHVRAKMSLQGRGNEPATRADIETAAQELYQADPAFFDIELMKKKIEELPALLNEEVIGQHQMKEDLMALDMQFYAGTHDPKKPGIRQLVVGPKGLGKTEQAKAYAIKRGLPFLRLEMNQYAERGADELLRDIATQLSKNAFSVIVIDEIEKATISVQNKLLGVLDSGSFTVKYDLNTSGRSQRSVTVSALNATIIATSNAGSRYIQSVLDQEHSKEALGFKMPGQEAAPGVSRNPKIDNLRLIKAAVEDGIADVVVDRFQVVSPALPPSREEFREVLQLHLRKAIAEQAQKQEVAINLANENEFLTEAVKKHYFAGMSNRDAPRIIFSLIRSSIAQAKFSGKVIQGGTLELTFQLDTNTKALSVCSSALKKGA